MPLHKIYSSLEKTVLPRIFFQASGNPVRKMKVYKLKLGMLNSAIKGYHEFHIRLHKNLELISATPIFLLTRVIL